MDLKSFIDYDDFNYHFRHDCNKVDEVDFILSEDFNLACLGAAYFANEIKPGTPHGWVDSVMIYEHKGVNRTRDSLKAVMCFTTQPYPPISSET